MVDDKIQNRFFYLSPKHLFILAILIITICIVRIVKTPNMDVHQRFYQAHAYLDRHEYTKAENLYQKILPELENSKEKNTHFHIKTLLDLGSIYYETKRYKKAELYLQRAWVMSRPFYHDRHYNTYAIVQDLGLVYLDLGQFDKAEPLLKQALAFTKSNQIPNITSNDEARASAYLGILYERMKRYSQAEKLLKQSIAIKKTAANDLEISNYVANIQRLYYEEGYIDKALSQKTRKDLGISQEAFDGALMLAGSDFYNRKQYPQVEDFCLKLLQSPEVKENLILQDILQFRVGQSYFAQGNFQEAKKYFSPFFPFAIIAVVIVLIFLAVLIFFIVVLVLIVKALVEMASTSKI